MSGSTRWIGAMVCLGALTGCAHAPAGRSLARPVPSLGHDPAPFRFTWGDGARRLVFRFEREPSGTTQALRSVFSHDGNGDIALAVGDRGTALVRHPQRGWLREDTRTRENLYAIGPACACPGCCTDATHIVVGAHGTALRRDKSGYWHDEQTGVSEDLYALVTDHVHGSQRTLAVGAGGVIVERSQGGTWHRVPSHTTAALHGIGYSHYHTWIVGAGGTTIDCGGGGGDGGDECIPRPPAVSADLRTVGRGVVAGAGVRLARAPDVPGVLSSPPWAIQERGADDIRATAIDLIDDRPVPRIDVGEGGVVRMEIFHDGARGSARLTLPFDVTLHGVVLHLADGYIVGDHGTIIHLAVDGAPEDNTMVL